MPVYRSKLDSPLEASPTKYRGSGLSPLDANPVKYRSRENSPQVAWIPPNIGGLIGWYKFNEGTGTVVNNYATDGSDGGGLLPNLNVVDTLGNFWSYLLGFGSTSDVYPTVTRAYADADFGTRTIGGSSDGYSCFGIFFKRASIATGLGVLFQTYSGLSWVGHQFSLQYPDENDVYLTTGPTLKYELFNEVLGYNNWYFFFISPDGDGRIHQVKPDGTKVNSTGGNARTVEAMLWGDITIGTLSPGSQYGSGGSYGDAIFYNKTELTLTQWASWYDELRGRYGMAARSGW